ncbi:16966_t:CDS:2 [Gigaspora rosea]|nr:16966_t:CDS:2 [Gigaspora rosea]
MWHLLSGIHLNPQTEQKFEIKIRVTNDEDKELCPPFKRVFFFGNNGKFLRNEEARLNLKEITMNGNVLNIRQPSVDWQKLIDKCERGFIIENGKVKKAKHEAFIINKSNIGLEAKKTLNGWMEIGQEECKNKFEGLLPKKEDLSEFLKKIPIEKYSYTVVKKAEFIVPESSTTLTEEFKNEVENALAKELTSEKIDELCQVSKKYGHFYARHIVFGGAIIEKLKNTETSKESFIRIIGGDRSYYDDIKINKKPWFDSLEDSQTWKIIEYDKVCPIFDLLDDKLRKEVLITLGQRILAGLSPVKVDGDTEPINTGDAYIKKSEPFETILEESGLMHPQAVYTSRFISLNELVTINSQAVLQTELLMMITKL